MTAGEKIERALRAVREAKVIAYDTETSGLDRFRNSVVGYVITGGIGEDESWYVPIRHGGGGNIRGVKPLMNADDPHTISAFEEELALAFKERERLGHRTIGHNIKYDLHMSANHKVDLGRNLDDTQLIQAMLDEYSRSYSLENSAKAHGVKPKLGDEVKRYIASRIGCSEKEAMGHFWEMPGDDPMIVEYAEGDGTTTLQLWYEQMKDIEEQEMGFICSVEMALIRTVFKMERHGVPVDKDYITGLREALIHGIEEAKAAMGGLNDRSSKDVRQFLEANGVHDWPKTEKGNPSFTEKFLKKSAPGRQIVDLRHMTTLLNTFVNPMVTEHMQNGRVHTNFHQLANDEFGTATGRFACSGPNLQAVPKRNKEMGKKFRRAFVAPEGRMMWDCDYSQCEPRLFAHYSAEPALVEGYSQKPFKDMHAVVAELMSVERDPTAKRMNMGILTGMQVKSFAGHMDWPLDKAEQMFNAWFDMFPGIRDFQEVAKNVMKRRGYVKTILGRRCRLDHPRFAYRGTSRIIQGGNADILKYKMLQADLYAESVGIDLVLTIHDSFSWFADDTPEGDKNSMEMVRILEDVQTDPINLRVPFVIDHNKATNWADATYGV